jgi:threonine dehydrogenase-like Zn-dependent dehydrogenase
MKVSDHPRPKLNHGGDRRGQSKVVSHHIAIEEAPEAYDKFDQRVDGYTKFS